MTKEKSRDSSIDIVAGCMILVMIVNHILQNLSMTDSWLNDILMLFSFFMPWFFFKGGQYYKYEKMDNAIHKGYKKLLVPYVLYVGIGIVVGLVITDIDMLSYLVLSFKEWCRYAAPSGNLPLWFLFSFFCVRLVMSFIAKSKITLITVLVMCFVACYGIHLGGG